MTTSCDLSFGHKCFVFLFGRKTCLPFEAEKNIFLVNHGESNLFTNAEVAQDFVTFRADSPPQIAAKPA